MADIINLRAKRKAADRKAARAQGDANAAKFGRTKAERALEAARAAKAARALDGHKRDGGPEQD
ncbi:MAG: hypothetical protein CFE34_10085 [Rhodobacteraceae bacterium PARR1]|nr:MAG: hypothetical protein CFE34_10085 [Rhodobacteraceae bacterium PARR1]